MEQNFFFSSGFRNLSVVSVLQPERVNRFLSNLKCGYILVVSQNLEVSTIKIKQN